MTKVLPWDEETTLLSWGHSEVVEIHRRRYMLKNNALEIFLINGKTMLLAFKSTKVGRIPLNGVTVSAISITEHLGTRLDHHLLMFVAHTCR